MDSQESYRNLVVQVIGEMSNKAAPHRKFVQTFVLAEQPNGYFVLNDIFRYINEEEEEMEPEPLPESEAPAPAAPETEIKTLSSSDDLAAQQHDAAQVSKKLEEQVAAAQASQDDDAADAPTTNGVSIPMTAAADVVEDVSATDIAQSEDQPGVTPEIAEPDDAVEAVELEKPKDPDPTPVASPPKAAAATPVQAATPAAPPKPAAPKTWANLVAANRIAPPAVPISASSTSPAPSQPKAAPPPPKQATTPPTPASDDFPSQTQQGSGAEWQTAGQENGKRQSRGQSVSAAGDNQNVFGYVKNVTEKVDESILENTLLQYGKLAYFDVSRQKVCPSLPVTLRECRAPIDNPPELRLCRIRRRRRLQRRRRRQPSFHRRRADLRRRASPPSHRLRRRLQPEQGRHARWAWRPVREARKPRPRCVSEGRRPRGLLASRSGRECHPPWSWPGSGCVDLAGSRGFEVV